MRHTTSLFHLPPRVRVVSAEATEQLLSKFAAIDYRPRKGFLLSKPTRRATRKRR